MDHRLWLCFFELCISTPFSRSLCIAGSTSLGENDRGRLSTRNYSVSMDTKKLLTDRPCLFAMRILSESLISLHRGLAAAKASVVLMLI